MRRPTGGRSCGPLPGLSPYPPFNPFVGVVDGGVSVPGPLRGPRLWGPCWSSGAAGAQHQVRMPSTHVRGDLFAGGGRVPHLRRAVARRAAAAPGHRPPVPDPRLGAGHARTSAGGEGPRSAHAGPACSGTRCAHTRTCLRGMGADIRVAFLVEGRGGVRGLGSGARAEPGDWVFEDRFNGTGAPGATPPPPLGF